MAGIRIDNVSKTYTLPDGSTRRALQTLNQEIGDGEFVALLGPSGCGKTTLLNIMSGLDTDFEGDVNFTGAQPNPVLSYMFQESRLLPWLSVRENLRFVIDGERRDQDALINDWLGRVGLSESGSFYPSQLSVGMQQRVALARALINEPEVLFMDEPLSSLDELTATQMRDELLSLWRQHRTTVVLVTHNPMEAVSLADRVLIMSPGPGRVIRDIDVSARLPRPRDAADTRLWELSRECVRILQGKE